MTVFTDEQQTYVQSNINEHVYLEACPGSGKTEVVAAKVEREVDAWNKFPGGMAILSFANSSTEELKKRIYKYLPHSSSLFPHFLGTFDSFIYKNIVNPLSHKLTGYDGESGDFTIRIIDESSTFPYRASLNVKDTGRIFSHHYFFSFKSEKFIFKSDINTLDKIRNSEEILKGSEAFNILAQAKKRMLKAGYAIYRDIEYLAVKATMLGDNDSFFELLAKRYPLIIIDECQDLSSEQLTILQKLSGVGVKLHFIGDLHQSIYGFRDVDPNVVQQFTIDNTFTNIQLTRNFRSCQKIINLCGALVGRHNIIGQLNQIESSCYLAQYETCPTELLGIFDELSAGYDNAVIVARGHSTLQKFRTSAINLKPIQKLALAIKLFNSEDMEAIEESIALYSEFIRYCIDECIKPNSFNCPRIIESNLVWRQFLFLSLDYISDDILKNMEVRWSVWTKKAKEYIRSLPEQSFVLAEIKPVIESMKAINLSAPSRQGAALVSDSLGQAARMKTGRRKTTIHGAKGETHDVTMLVSSASAGGQPGPHWKSWLQDEDSEAARFAYVASSRPKHRLIWGVKKLKPVERKRFEELGFNII
jgi:DNA helicase-2/ATP-dependent DNA helicase PcrA